MWIGYALEGLVAGLLVVTIVYCVLLDRRLRALRSGEDGLKDVILGLNDATLRAQQSITQLRTEGGTAGQDLTKLVRGGRALVDELSLMVEAGNNLANRLERGSDAVSNRIKDEETRKEGSYAARPVADGAGESGRYASSDGETALLKALRNAR